MGLHFGVFGVDLDGIGFLFAFFDCLVGTVFGGILALDGGTGTWL